MALLKLEQVGLKTALGRVDILQDVSFEVERGDRLALLGHSGAGKTSLLRLLNRLSEASQGKIFFDNQNIQQIPPLQLRQQVTLLPQESKLLGMTVQQALSYPLQLRGVPQPKIQQRLTTWTEMLHIPQDWLNRTEVQLSVGQRQWVAIARALIIQPQVLLLDEPTSALDAGRASHLLKILKDLSQAQQMTILMINHQLDLAQSFCTRALQLKRGRLTQDQMAAQMDWVALQQDLQQTELEESQEWDEL
ncbi:MAG: ATP-binding cassette domain-containing protein [Oculatellaceae cyanobacterium Prado106]|jgi:D-methionine transport system ATP-binding protein|nr:ATP-binding cassette domain-containing protein [Oculatellaceae cyanobacterium Prado106]